MQFRKELITYIALFIILALLPIFIYKDSYLIGLLITCMIWGTMAAVWNFTMGYAGIFTFGQFGFFAVGAYVSGMLAKHLGLSPWFTMLAGGSGACLVGLLIGIPCMRLKGSYIALITWALHLYSAHNQSRRTVGHRRQHRPYVDSINQDRHPRFFQNLAFALVLHRTCHLLSNSTGDIPDHLFLCGTGIYRTERLGRFCQDLGHQRIQIQTAGIRYIRVSDRAYRRVLCPLRGAISPRILGLDIFLLVMLMLIIAAYRRISWGLYRGLYHSPAQTNSSGRWALTDL